MGDYLIIAGESDAAPEAQRELLAARSRFTEELRTRGALRDAERMRPSAEGVRVTRREEETTVERGPFGGTLGAYWAVRAADLDAAVELARRLPTEPGEHVELRPVMKGNYEPEKADHTGRIFGFGVLGSSPSEEAWIRMMNRIDTESSTRLGGGVLAGIRLEAPRTGRVLANLRGEAVVLDGPFLESREVIGGLFFMRWPGLDEAISWVSSTAFVKLGAAEIREVWRS